MSQEDVESMRRSYEALNQALSTGDDLLSLMEGIDPEIVIEMGVLEGTFHGREGFRGSLRDRWRCLRIFGATPRNSSTRVTRSSFRCALARRRGARDSRLLPRDPRLDSQGRATRLRLYESRAKALEAVGLRE